VLAAFPREQLKNGGRIISVDTEDVNRERAELETAFPRCVIIHPEQPTLVFNVDLEIQKLCFDSFAPQQQPQIHFSVPKEARQDVLPTVEQKVAAALRDLLSAEAFDQQDPFLGISVESVRESFLSLTQHITEVYAQTAKTDKSGSKKRSKQPTIWVITSTHSLLNTFASFEMTSRTCLKSENRRT
jgi:hypothetical protein